MKRIRFVLLLLIVLATSTSCEKSHECTEMRFLRIGPSIDKFHFLEGSWWVYQNDSTLELDTIRVIGSNLSDSLFNTSTDPADNPCITQHYYKVDFDNQTYWIHTDILMNRYSDSIGIPLLDNTEDANFYYDGSFFSTNTQKHVNEDTLLVDGIEYYDVEKFQILVPPINYEFTFFDDNIGRVKWHLVNVFSQDTLESWSLKSYNIVR